MKKKKKIHGRLRTNKGILQCKHIITVAPARHYCVTTLLPYLSVSSGSA